MFTGVGRRFFPLNTVPLFPPGVELPPPAFRRLARHPRGPGLRVEKSPDDCGGFPAAPPFAENLAEERPVVRAFGLVGGIVIPPGEVDAPSARIAIVHARGGNGGSPASASPDRLRSSRNPSKRTSNLIQLKFKKS